MEFIGQYLMFDRSVCINDEDEMSKYVDGLMMFFVSYVVVIDVNLDVLS